MQLPTPQLTEAMEMCPELKTSLNEHLLTFTESQRAHIPSGVQEIVLGPTETTQPQPVQPVRSFLYNLLFVICRI